MEANSSIEPRTISPNPVVSDTEPKSRPSTNDLQEPDSAHYKSVVDCDKPITDRQSKRSEKPMGSSETSSRENNPTKRKRSFTQDEDSAHKKGEYERIGRTFEKLDGRSGTARKDTNLRVAIIGGGIGGLALATFLASSEYSSASLDVTIYEAGPSLTELGAGVGIWLRTWRILTSISFPNAKDGLENDLTRIAPAGRDMSTNIRKAFEFHRGDCENDDGPFYTMMVPFGVLTLHRADFQRTLAAHSIPPTKIYFNKKLIYYSYTDERDLFSTISLTFSDGTTAYTDILVGADGIRSITRKLMFKRLLEKGDLSASDPPRTDLPLNLTPTNKPDTKNFIAHRSDSPSILQTTLASIVEPIWTGTHVYRYLIPLSELEIQFPGHRAGKGPIVYFGKNKHIIAFPIDHVTFVSGVKARKPMINIVAFTSEPNKEGSQISDAWVREAQPEELLDNFRNWNSEVLALLELVKNPLLWAIHTVRPLPRYSDADGRVVLLGDAAHAMTPHQGAGGGQAIEDAYVLAALLAHPLTNIKTIPVALRAYDEVRIPISQDIAHRSRLTGMMYEFNHVWDQMKSECEVRTETEKLKILADSIMDIHHWEWDSEPQPTQKESAMYLYTKFLKTSDSLS